MPLTKIDDRGLTTPIDLLDNEKVRLGTGNDLQIYHDGTDSRIENTTNGDLKIINGGNSAMLIQNQNSYNIEIKTNAEDAIKCIANSAVALYYDNSKKFETTSVGSTVTGKLGIGTTSPGYDVTVYKSSGTSRGRFHTAGTTGNDYSDVAVQAGNNYAQMFVYGTGQVYMTASAPATMSVGNIANSALYLTTNNTIRQTIANDGKVGIGTAPASIFHTSSSSDHVITHQTTTSGADIRLNFRNNGGTDAGGIHYLTNGNALKFITNASEGMRMSSNQNIFIHCTNNSGSNGRIYTNGTNGGNLTILEVNQNNGSGSEMITFRNGGSQLGTIHQSGSGVNYQSNSDYRLKENDVAISDGITRIKQLRPIRFNWKEDSNTTVDGFFAHEVSPVVPESVRGKKDEVFDTDGVGTQVVGGPKYQQLDQSKLIPLLTAALQEAIAKIETLETKVAALEAG